jgi:hypothetical protein
MAADRSKYPVVHLVRQHPVGGCRSRVPYSRRSGWAPSPAPARRRDRHPQDLNPLFAGGSGRTPRNRASQKRGTLQVHAMVGKVLREIPRLTDRQDRNRWAVWKKAPVLAKRCRAWRHGMGHDGDVDRVRLILISPYRLARNIRSP